MVGDAVVCVLGCLWLSAMTFLFGCCGVCLFCCGAGIVNLVDLVTVACFWFDVLVGHAVSGTVSCVGVAVLVG